MGNFALIIKYIKNCKFKCLKPIADTRDKDLKSKLTNLTEKCIFVNEKTPNEILAHITLDLNLLIIDEIQFFSSQIVEVIETLSNWRIIFSK